VSDLFGILSLSARALEAQRVGLDVTGHNIANANTPGYSRRVVDFASIAPSTRLSAGEGVEVEGIRAQRDRLIDRRLQFETTGAERHATIAESIGSLESAVATGAGSIDTRLNQFFDSWSRLTARPTDAVARQDVILSGQAVAAAFSTTVGRIEDLGRDTDQRVMATVHEINELTDRIAQLNVSLAANGGVAGLQAQDEQQQLVGQLAALTNIQVVTRPDGGVDIDAVGGRALVIGNSSYTLGTDVSGPSGYHTITLGGDDITASLTGGRLGGLLEVRDTLLPGYVAMLDDQASALATAINTAHAAGFDAAGNAGQDFFAFSVPPQGNVGAAAALMVDDAVAADGRLVAAAGSPQPGDNEAARAIAGLRGARIANGGTATLTESWGQFVARIGRDVQSAASERDVRGEIVDQIQSLRDQVSGVSLDEEALNLMKFQRAYEANARVFRAVDDALQVLFDSLGR
jgi:flagellar hook-associated protein 1